MGIAEITLQQIFSGFGTLSAGFLAVLAVIKGIEYLLTTTSTRKKRQREKDKRIEVLDNLAQKSDDIIDSLNALKDMREEMNNINIELIEIKEDARKTKMQVEQNQLDNAAQDRLIAESMLDRQRLIKNDIAVLTALQKLGASEETEKAIRDTHEYLIKRLSTGQDLLEED